MALELLGFQWLTLIFLAVHKVNAMQDFDINIMPKNLSFDCELHINGTNWSMECDSDNFELKTSSKFFTLQLHGSLSLEKPLSFRDILNSISFNESKIYFCDSEWRYFILIDPSTLNSNCKKKKNLRKLVYTLDELSLIKIEISYSEKPEYILNIISNCIQLQDVLMSKTHVTNMTFLPVYSNNTIKILNLSKNRIQTIADDLFNELHNLNTLDLSHNQLKSINNNLFSGITHVINLELSHNIIEYISNNALKHLVKLEYISLRNNKLQNIDEDIFRNNSFLSIIDISNNDLKNLPPTLFHNMSNLKNVSCTNCSLSSFDKDIFKNSSNIAWIIFKENSIRYIHPDTFKYLNFLEVLDLKGNNLSHFCGTLFSNHPYLMYVNVSDNNVSNLSLDVFTGARNLRYLDFSNNRIASNLTDSYFTNFTDLEHFRLNHNRIAAVELGISGPVRVRKLEINYNHITKFNVIWKQLTYLEIFDVNYNFLTSIDLPPCIPNIKQTLTFNFQYNRISKINMEALIYDEKKAKIDKTLTCFVNGLARNYVDLTHNPLLCDCKMYPFYKYIRDKSPRRYQIEIFVDKGNITCENPDSLRNYKLDTLPDDVLSCPISDKCPQPCYCGIRGNDDSIFVNCSSRSLQDVPQTFPHETTVLYFNRNRLKSMESLNNNTWSSLIELHLDYNFLTNLDNWEFPTSLRYLSVRGNQLKTLPTPLMQFISNSTNFQLYFGNNDYKCDCDRKLLKNFLRENINFIKDNDNILCNLTNNNTFELLPLTSVFDSVLCSREIRSKNQMRLVIFLCVFFSILIMTMLLYFRQRQLILSYFYVHCRSLYDFFYADPVDDDAIFDAFVAYSSNDREIVFQLLEVLENNPPFFQLCIHERNWLPGCFITDNIANSVENSRRTIIILSSTFITSPWFNVELRAAVCKMAQDAMNRIIVILADKTVSIDKIDPELRFVVSKRTYLEWGERWFWEKLRYALPRKSIEHDILDNQRSGSISEVALIPYKKKKDNISQ